MYHIILDSKHIKILINGKSHSQSPGKNKDAKKSYMFASFIALFLNSYLYFLCIIYLKCKFGLKSP